MKIIGKLQCDNLLLEASRDDVARLIGYYYGGAEGCPPIDVGMEIDIWEMYRRFYNQEHFKTFLADIQRCVREAMVAATIPCPVLQPKAAEGTP